MFYFLSFSGQERTESTRTRLRSAMPWVSSGFAQNQQKRLAPGKSQLLFCLLLLKWQSLGQHPLKQGLGQKAHVFRRFGEVRGCLDAHTEATVKRTQAAPDLLLLPNPMSSGLSLKIILGVPVRVKDNNSISRGQINPQPSSSCWQQETEVLGMKK